MAVAMVVTLESHGFVCCHGCHMGVTWLLCVALVVT